MSSVNEAADLGKSGIGMIGEDGKRCAYAEVGDKRSGKDNGVDCWSTVDRRHISVATQSAPSPTPGTPRQTFSRRALIPGVLATMSSSLSFI